MQEVQIFYDQFSDGKIFSETVDFKIKVRKGKYSFVFCNTIL